MASALLQQVYASCKNCPFQERLHNLEGINAGLENRIATLEAKLAKFENPHISSSLQRFKKNEKKNQKSVVHPKVIKVLPGQCQLLMKLLK